MAIFQALGGTARDLDGWTGRRERLGGHAFDVKPSRPYGSERVSPNEAENPRPVAKNATRAGHPAPWAPALPKAIHLHPRDRIDGTLARRKFQRNQSAFGRPAKCVEIRAASPRPSQLPPVL